MSDNEEINKLKTLKDITIPEMSMTKGYKVVTNPKWVNKDMLRLAAEEWIKELDNDEVTKIENYHLDPSENIEFYIKLWICHFFNLNNNNNQE